PRGRLGPLVARLWWLHRPAVGLSGVRVNARREHVEAVVALAYFEHRVTSELLGFFAQLALGVGVSLFLSCLSLAHQLSMLATVRVSFIGPVKLVIVQRCTFRHAEQDAATF